MMPDLGKYQGAVLSAYLVSLVLLAAIVMISVWRARSVKRQLEDTEQRAATSK